MYAELVCGPPGSGKTTYCEAKRQFFAASRSRRRVITLNLDPANEGIFPYPCDIDICSLISQRTVMEEEQLGPNGSYLFCVDWVGHHLSEIREQIEQYVTAARRLPAGNSAGNASNEAAIEPAPIWLLVDCPGQVEFYLNSDGMKDFLRMLQKEMRMSVCVVHLCDVIVATRDVATYVSTCLATLALMVDAELPQLNVLTKWSFVTDKDGDESGGRVDPVERAERFLDAGTFFSEYFELSWREQEEDRHPPSGAPSSSASDGGESSGVHYSTSKLFRLSKALLAVIEGYGSLVGFVPLDVESAELMRAVAVRVDGCVGMFEEY